MPGNKPTAEERRRRILMVISKLEDGESAFKIRAYLPSEFGLSKSASCRYVQHARKLMIGDLGQLSDIKSEQFYGYRAIARDKTQKTVDRLRAMKAIDKLLGLEGGKETVQIATGTPPVDPADVPKLRSRVVELLGMWSNPAHPQGGGSGSPGGHDEASPGQPGGVRTADERGALDNGSAPPIPRQPPH
jgi:hypothetical protein